MNSWLLYGIRSTFPITFGVIPFGAVMGTVAADAGLSFYQSFFMNFMVYGGASQLAAIDLMKNETATIVVVATGLMINLRFLLYSAALTPVVQNSKTLLKIFCAFHLTDQSYAVVSSHQEKLKSTQDTVLFYIGSVLCMLIVWHSSVSAGYIFGNFAPESFSLDFAIPLSFVALVVPTIKNWKYLAIAVLSSVLSLIFYQLPFGSGLMVTALISLFIAGFFLEGKKA